MHFPWPIGKRKLDRLPYGKVWLAIMNLSQYLEQSTQSATELATAVGCETSTITRIIRGERRPSINLAARIERATGGKVSIKDFAEQVAS